MKTRLRKILIRIHFVSLAIAIVNAIIKNLTVYSLESSLEFGVEIATIASGIIIFFIYSFKKAFRVLNFYFSFYVLVTFIFIIGLIFRGIVWMVALSIILHSIYPDDKKYEDDGIIISVPFQGFMGSCCPYEIKERKLLIFEKSYGKLEVYGSINFETMKIKSTESKIELTYSLEKDRSRIRETTIEK